MSGGAAFCWGRNGYGQLGDGTLASVNYPVPTQGGLTFVTLAVGQDHTCGLTGDGTAYCWGADDYGQVGDGTETATPRTSPTLVTGSHLFRAPTLALGRRTPELAGGMAP
jgi:alpha-tubulin suppressor-like RCC1 family protein